MGCARSSSPPQHHQDRNVYELSLVGTSMEGETSVDIKFGEEEANRRHFQIEKEILEDQKTSQHVLKVLLLGSSGSGKSTIVKQMKILHLNGFNNIELINLRYIVYQNVIEAIQKIVTGLQSLQVFLDYKTQASVDRFNRFVHDTNGTYLDEASCLVIESIWRSKVVQQGMRRKTEFTIPDNAEHYLNNLARIGHRDFLPTDLDVLFCRQPTNGIFELKFPLKDKTLSLIDVGGQKSERRKWIHCFDDVTAIMFVAALSDYDVPGLEDPDQSRLKESKRLFDETLSSDFMKKSATLLFLNKKDIFQQKIAKIPLTVCFGTYKGDNQFSEAQDYIKERFVQSQISRRHVYCHFTNATDTNNIQVVFTASADVILKKNLGKVAIF